MLEPHFEVVEDLAACENKLLNFIPDVVISDYNLPSCDGFEIMQLVNSTVPDMPLIFITGAIEDEELASHTILARAIGFIPKKHMASLDEKLKPLLKKVVYNMVLHDDLRERIRKNKIAVNQIYSYLDTIQVDNEKQQEDIKKIREDIGKFNSGLENVSET